VGRTIGLGAGAQQIHGYFKYAQLMTRGHAILGSLLFTFIVPGTVAGIVPWLITGWHRGADLFGVRGAWAVGVVLIALGLPVLLGAIYKFATEGLGTPAPTAPTQHLVIGGPHRFVRNPMYIAVVAIILRQALLLGQPALLWYAALVALATAAFVHFYEEPILHSQFGDEYVQYRKSVHAWLPRITPYHPR
jgi:protein-S-isoprenylcysteine O-methyltransferase Ste14